MQRDLSYRTNYSPYIEMYSPSKQSSSKYKYQAKQPTVNRTADISQFSPYKQHNQQIKRNVQADSTYSSNKMGQFSPYKRSHQKRSPIDTSFEKLQYKQHGLIDILKQTDFKAIQHTAKARQHIIQQLSLINHQLKDQVTYYKEMANKLQMQLSLGKDTHRAQMYQLQNIKKQKIIQQMKQQIKILIYKNNLLEKQFAEFQMSTAVKQKQLNRSKRKQFDNNIDKENSNNSIREIEDIINKQYVNNRYLSQFICCKRDVKGNISCMIKRLSKLQSFVRSIFEVRAKIQKQKDNDLKKTWRWIKSIVEEAIKYRRLKQYESTISHKIGFNKVKSIEELIKHLVESK